MRRIGRSRHAGQDRFPIRHQAFQKRHRPWRRRHHLAWIIPQPQGKLQHVKGLVGMFPFGELIAPGEMKLRPAQAFRVFRREDLCDRPVRPDQPAPRNLDHRPHLPCDPCQTGGPVDHHLARIAQRFRHQRNAQIRALAGRQNPGLHPFGPGPRLARSAPAEDQPVAPVSVRRHLLGPRQKGPVAREKGEIRGG